LCYSIECSLLASLYYTLTNSPKEKWEQKVTNENKQNEKYALTTSQRLAKTKIPFRVTATSQFVSEISIRVRQTQMVT
jgi:hypothetical protein